MKNVIFQNNTLLKLNNGKRISQIYIQSEKPQNINLDQISFYSNLLHQSADDLSENMAGLIFVSSQQSNATINNILSKQNIITNSSCSFLYFIINRLVISNYSIDELNIINRQLLEKFMFNQELFNRKTSEELQLVVLKTVTIQTKGSACYATVTELEVKNCVFQNIISQTTPLFDLKTEGKGLITFTNLIIRNVDVMYDSNLELKGSFAIYSLNSYLNLKFINIIFDKVRNKFSPSILSITPSLRQNNILFKDLQIVNSFSLQNQIISAEFSEIQKEFNFVHFQNVSIIQTEQAWLDYFKKIGQINSQDLQKIMNDNAMINIVSCTLIIDNLFLQGVIQSPVIKTLNAINLQIVQCKFISIQTFYQFNIIQIGQNKQNSMRIYVNNNEFKNIQLFKPNNEQLIQQQLLLNKLNIDQNCFIDNNNLIFSQNSFSFRDIIRQMQFQQSQGSLIKLESLSNQSYIQIYSLKLLKNDCDFCFEGLISISIQQIQLLKIKEFVCMKNYIIGYGCVNIQSNKDNQNQFTLSDSVMALNVGNSGLGITFINLKGIIQRTLIFNNQAVNFAGGMDFKVLEDGFKLKNIFIFQNQAKFCGGIQTNNQLNLQINNIVSSYLLFNKADWLANNLVETPILLALKINNQIMKHNLVKSDNITISILEIPVQRVIQQNNVYFTNNLMIPSNQKIVDYKIFDLQTLQFIPYITEFSLLFLNSQREQLGNFEEQNCTVFQNIMTPNAVLVNQSELFLVSFNAKLNIIDLGHLYFTFDPYQKSQYIQEIEILCKISDNQALSYKFQTKSFYCQIGEFYTNGGCQTCDSKFGFYSVSYNATKCSIFDKTKFSEITSSAISLHPGFWRPDYFSDQPEFCYYKQNNCLGGWSIGDSSCIKGNLGGLCYECDFYNVRGNGYYFKNTENDECSLCDDSNNYVVYFVIVSLIAMVSIFMTLRSIEKTNQLFNNLKVGKKYGKIIFKLNQDHESFLIKMFVNYLWIFSLIFTYNINFSINMNIVDQASNTSYSMANNLDCFLAEMQEINLVYIRLIATIFFIFIQFILVYLIFILISKFKKSNIDLSNISNTGLYLYISNNAALTKQFCSLIAKKTISNIDFVQGNMALRFDSITHQNWIFMFILPGLSINGCVIPLLLITILFLKRNQIDQIKIRKYFCYLFNEYNESNYYWEQIKIWQKTILIIIMIYFEAEVLMKTILFGLTLVIYQYLANYFKPYIILSLNKLDYQAGLLCCIAIFLAAARNESNLSSSFEISNILQITIAFLCLLLIYLYINILLKAYYKKYKLTALLLLLTITKKLSSGSIFTDSLQKIILKEQNKRERLQINYEKLQKYLIKIYKLNSLMRQEQTQKMDQTFHFLTNKSIKLQYVSETKE